MTSSMGHTDINGGQAEPQRDMLVLKERGQNAWRRLGVVVEQLVQPTDSNEWDGELQGVCVKQHVNDTSVMQLGVP